jgi:hypothetical protein
MDWDEDSKAMRPAFLKAVKDLEAVFERKAPVTDLARDELCFVGAYAKVKTTEIHSRALEIAIGRKLGPPEKK